MPDISMCENNTCPKRGTCYRFVGIASPVQNYGDFKPNKNGVCEFYYPLEDGMRIDKFLMNELNKK